MRLRVRHGLGAIQSGRVRLVTNTATGDRRPRHLHVAIRRPATEWRVPCFASLDTLGAAIAAPRDTFQGEVRTQDEYPHGVQLDERGGVALAAG